MARGAQVQEKFEAIGCSIGKSASLAPPKTRASREWRCHTLAVFWLQLWCAKYRHLVGAVSLAGVHSDNQGGCLMSPTSKRLASFAVAAALSSAAGAQGLVTQKNIPLAMAQTIANAALAKCESMGFKVSVVVVDRDGLPIVMLRGDGSGLHTPEGADRKAYTARTFSQPSAAFTKRMIDDPNSVGSRQYTRVLALSGGLPIKAGDDVVGAVGVSGSPGKDDVCSQAGIDKVADLLN
jgi:uncharacterized protein GlcG (DUF336 family)